MYKIPLGPGHYSGFLVFLLALTLDTSDKVATNLSCDILHFISLVILQTNIYGIVDINTTHW